MCHPKRYVSTLGCLWKGSCLRILRAILRRTLIFCLRYSTDPRQIPYPEPNADCFNLPMRPNGLQDRWHEEVNGSCSNGFPVRFCPEPAVGATGAPSSVSPPTRHSGDYNPTQLDQRPSTSVSKPVLYLLQKLALILL